MAKNKITAEWNGNGTGLTPEEVAAHVHINERQKEHR